VIVWPPKPTSAMYCSAPHINAQKHVCARTDGALRDVPEPPAPERPVTRKPISRRTWLKSRCARSSSPPRPASTSLFVLEGEGRSSFHGMPNCQGIEIFDGIACSCLQMKAPNGFERASPRAVPGV